MLHALLEFSIRQRAVVLLGALGLLAAGAYALLHLPVDAVPDLTGPQVQVNVNVPALAPEESERAVTRPIAAAFGVSELVAIELERDAAGNPTGGIRGTPSFREGKVVRVEQWLTSRGLSWSDVTHSSFYSDSINDLPLLEKVTEPVATNPDPRLSAIATERGWRILNLFE